MIPLTMLLVFVVQSAYGAGSTKKLLTLSLNSASKTNQATQQKTGGKVVGVIVDEEGEPMIGVTIRIKGTGKGTITNFDGEFTIEMDNRKTPLVFSYIGKEDIERAPVIGQKMKLVMKDSQLGKKLDEVVVVGYGTMKKRDVTGSIASIGAKEIENKMATNVYDALQGSTAGVQVVSGSGQPGESSTIKVRGTSTFSSEGVAPLYIVDGAPMESIDDINPSDIVSVEVLKDAASAAI